MDDLRRYARMFEASTKLQSTSDLLVSLSGGVQLTDPEKETLAWTGSYLNQVDWDSNRPTKTGLSLDAHATVTRPTFYGAIISFGERFVAIGINKPVDLRMFLARLYDTLNSADISASKMTLPEVYVASELLSNLSHSLLGTITNDGAPVRTGEFRLESFLL